MFFSAKRSADFTSFHRMRWHVALCLLGALVFTAVSAKTDYDCDFESGFGRWTTLPGYYLFDFKIGQQGTPSQGTGPLTDASGHTMGHFANIRVVREKKDSKTLLSSPSMRSYAKSTSCQMHFSYSIYNPFPTHCANSAGDTVCRRYNNPRYKARVCNPAKAQYYNYMKQSCAKVCGIYCGQLNIAVSGATRENLFSLKYSQNSMWTDESVSIPEKFTGGSMEISIEATVSWDLNSYIAIDNIYFTGCNFNKPTTKAPTTTQRPTTTTTTTPTTTPTTIPLSSIRPDMYNCNFNQGTLCGWRSDSKDWRWGIASQGIPNNGTGPPEDADGFPTGMYSLMKVTRGRHTAAARFISPRIDQFKYSPKCRLKLKYSTFSPSFYYCKNQDGDAACKKYANAVSQKCSSEPVFANQHCSKLCGAKCTNFKVYVTNDVSNLSAPLAHVRTPKDEKWYPIDVPIGKQTAADFWVVLEGISGWDSLAYIAVDNIEFIGCETKITPPTTTTLFPPSTTTSTQNASTVTGTTVASVTSVATVTPVAPGVRVAQVVPKVHVPRKSVAKPSAGEEGSNGSTLGLALGIAGAAVAAIVIVAAVTYHIRKKKAIERSSSVAPLKEAWK